MAIPKSLEDRRRVFPHFVLLLCCLVLHLTELSGLVLQLKTHMLFYTFISKDGAGPSHSPPMPPNRLGLRESLPSQCQALQCCWIWAEPSSGETSCLGQRVYQSTPLQSHT